MLFSETYLTVEECSDFKLKDFDPLCRGSIKDLGVGRSLLIAHEVLLNKL